MLYDEIIVIIVVTRSGRISVIYSVSLLVHHFAFAFSLSPMPQCSVATVTVDHYHTINAFKERRLPEYSTIFDQSHCQMINLNG